MRKSIRTDLVLEAHELLKENEFREERRDRLGLISKMTVRKI
ncbi:endopeptidase spore protease Gpr [Acetivibrio straminisolvens JCM 21531]|uniref:Endopeptidase spore protease Gpr n=1 Tax=Acetivibrio straminisolvens JCM 21531 TaxID=1294263 RepID=W4V3Z8_9FIRM|nr:endopeptidase spore protease Gpr [Acetivibrio straminisolvens JCM 21531]